MDLETTKRLDSYRTYSLLLETILLSEQLKSISDKTKVITDQVESIIKDLKDLQIEKAKNQ